MAEKLTVQEFRDRIDSANPKCRICGFAAHSLVRHLADKHGKSVGQYKNEYGATTQVCSPITSELLRTLDRRPKRSEDLEDFVAAFQGNKANEIFNDVRKQFGPCNPSLTGMVPVPNPDFVFDAANVKAICYGLLRGANVFVEGPTGSRKTDGVEQIHAHIGLPIKRVNMNGDVTVANFIGAMRADPAKEPTTWMELFLPR